ncbi:hypothetical protein [Agromyces aurantiacus]|uniref:hypothetical protein n=1 Tax=Agromyces aurantiacus TaxID=165814 RepID=UPI0019587136|nr:hypothetical protein [Agromyces aurantiacus]MBM7504221.1 hypothetical protein [Agromyces aurantiacus]
MFPGRHQLESSLLVRPESTAGPTERIGLALALALRDLGRRRLGVEAATLYGHVTAPSTDSDWTTSTWRCTGPACHGAIV